MTGRPAAAPPPMRLSFGERLRVGLAVRWRRLCGDPHAHLWPLLRLLRRSPLFAPDWYRETYTDVAASGIDPALHYAAYGHAEGRDPGPDFSTHAYLTRHRDVARAGLNALAHYELHGRVEGRQVAYSLLNQDAASQTKASFRRACKTALQAFLAGEERLRLPSAEAPLVSIVLVLYNQAELTYQCLRSLQATLDVPAQVIVVDNASSDDTGAMLARIDNVEVLRQSTNLHFLLGANAGAARARGRYLLFLNNDAIVEPGAIATAASVLEELPHAGAVGGKILMLDGLLQEAGCIVLADGDTAGYVRGGDPAAGEFGFRREVDYCSGAFLMVRRALFEQLGGFDTLFAPAYYEEADLCMRLHDAGHAVIYDPRIVITHFEYGSAGQGKAPHALVRVNREKFLARYAHRLRNHARRGDNLLYARMRGAQRCRVLFIDDEVPRPAHGGGLPRAHAFVTGLFGAGAFVTHYPIHADRADPAQQRAALPLEIEIAGTGELGLADFLRERAGYYDAVVISRPHNMVLFQKAFRGAGWPAGSQVIYDAESIVALREAARERLGLGAALGISLEEEMALAHAAHTVLAVNEAEAALFRAAGCADVRVLGHKLPELPLTQGFEGRGDLLFVGRLEETNTPNADSIRWFVREVMPRLDVLLGASYALHVVGGCAASISSDLASERVRFHGRVQDLRPFYDSARVFIVPTRFAAGIAHKVHEAASHGVPLVATSLIAGQMGWQHEVELLAAESPEAFAQACARLHEDAQLWERLRLRARERARCECDPTAFAAVVAGLLPHPPRDSQGGPRGR